MCSLLCRPQVILEPQRLLKSWHTTLCPQLLMQFSSQYKFDIVFTYFFLKSRRRPACSNDVVLSALDRIPYNFMHFATYFLHCMIHGVRGNRSLFETDLLFLGGALLENDIVVLMTAVFFSPSPSSPLPNTNLRFYLLQPCKKSAANTRAADKDDKRPFHVGAHPARWPPFFGACQAR